MPSTNNYVKKVKTKLSNSFKLLLFKLGFRMHYHKNTKNLFLFLNKLEISERAYELRNISLLLRETNNVRDYQKLIQHLVPDYPIITTSFFVGNGASKGSLKAFRKIEIEGKPYFEKIYFTSHIEFQKNKFFYDHIFPLLKEKIKIPSKHHTFPSDFISAVHYQYLALEPLKSSKVESTLISFAKTLIEISFIKESIFHFSRVTSFLFDYQTHFLFANNYSKTEQLLESQGIDFKACIQKINQSERVLSHGDLYTGNCFEQNILLDWDNFGFYPIGFDISFFFQRIRLYTKHDNPFTWLKQNFSDTMPVKHWNSLEFNFSLFLLVFLQSETKQVKKSMREEKKRETEMFLLSEIKQLL